MYLKKKKKVFEFMKNGLTKMAPVCRQVSVFRVVRVFVTTYDVGTLTIPSVGV